MNTASERLDSLIDAEWGHGREIQVDLTVESECAWSGQLRYTPEPNRQDGPDRSFVFYAAGCDTPDSVIERLLEDFHAWRSETGVS